MANLFVVVVVVVSLYIIWHTTPVQEITHSFQAYLL